MFGSFLGVLLCAAAVALFFGPPPRWPQDEEW